NWVSFCCYHPERISMVSALAARLGFYQKPGNTNVWARYNAGALAEWMRYNLFLPHYPLRSPYKQVPDLVKCASMRQIKHFLKFFGDQNHTGSQEVYYSSSKRLIDDLQELLLRIGRRGA